MGMTFKANRLASLALLLSLPVGAMEARVARVQLSASPVFTPASVGAALFAPALPGALPVPIAPLSAAVLPKALPAGLFDGAVPSKDDDVLAGARPVFSLESVRLIQETDRAMTRAVRAAVSAVLGKAQVISRGSTSRGTYAHPNPDYDIGVNLPASWSKSDFQSFVAEDSERFKGALASAIKSEASDLFHDGRVLVEIRATRLSDPVTYQPAEGVALYRATVSGTGGLPYAEVDVSVTNDPRYGNAYPQYFAEQLRQVERLGGPPAVSRLLSDIQLAKRFFSESVGAYKSFNEMGPSAVGIEQMVMQSGRVSDADQGRTILEAGSFDKLMERLARAGYDDQGEPRDFSSFQDAWTVHNAFMEPANFLSLMKPGADAARKPSWRRASAAALNYLQARAAGGSSSLSRLKPVWSKHPRQARAFVTIERHARWNKVHGLFKRLMSSLGRGASYHAGDDGPVMRVEVRLASDVDPETQIARIKAYFEKNKGMAELVSIVDEAPPKASGDSAGKLTLDMLQRFTTLGPKPAQRGLEYRYAQGAETLPAGLEESWEGWKPAPAPRGGRLETQRTQLLRRGDRVFALILGMDDRGPLVMHPVPVDPALAQGVISDSLVELTLDGDRPVSVRPVGAYRQDMMIGRVARRGGKLVLEGLFRDKNVDVSLYSALPLEGGSLAVREGAIVQAFVSPTAAGFKATPLIDLGLEITPEIAARETALRRGARGYFPKSVIEQAEGLGREDDPARDFARIKAVLDASEKGKVEDLRAKDFVTVDPPGAGDLDDAFYVEKDADGGYTWYLATADVAHYVHPGSPAFQAAARIGNTFYSIDKDGVPEYPMNHPVVSKNLASLLSGKDSLAMISRMKFDAKGNFLIGGSEVFLGLVHVKGRYTYPQVAGLWSGAKDHGVKHIEQVRLARELSEKLARRDDERGKMHLTLGEVEHHKRDGKWVSEVEKADPLASESHHLIEELKVYGNRAIGVLLEDISKRTGVPHVSRVHPMQNEAVTKRLKRDLLFIGAPWEEGVTLSRYLASVQESKALDDKAKQAAQLLVLTSRQSAKYASNDEEGHEGLALAAGAYDHPSAPIRRFSDMYNRGLLETHLEGGDVKAYYAAVLADLKALGFAGFDDYLTHLNGRQQAAKQMDYEVDAFMSVYELSRPENAGRAFKGHVRMVRGGRFPSATIELEGSAATVVVDGPAAAGYRLLETVEVTVKGADLVSRKVDFTVRKTGKARGG